MQIIFICVRYLFYLHLVFIEKKNFEIGFFVSSRIKHDSSAILFEKYFSGGSNEKNLSNSSQTLKHFFFYSNIWLLFEYDFEQGICEQMLETSLLRYFWKNLAKYLMWMNFFLEFALLRVECKRLSISFLSFFKMVYVFGVVRKLLWHNSGIIEFVCYLWSFFTYLPKCEDK